MKNLLNLGKKSGKKLGIATLFVLLGVSAFAQENTAVPADCQKAAIRKAYVQFRKDSGWTSDEANNFAYLHDPFHQEQDPANVVTVSVESTDVRAWDGYAAYKITIQPSREGCLASDAVLAAGDGL